MKTKLFLLISLSFQLQSAPFNQEAYCYLDELAKEAGTDKCSNFHNYTKVYSQHFDSIKDLPLKFLEIGVYKGASIKLWENYFQNSELHFIDSTYSYLTYKPKRAHLHTANQENRSELLAAMHECGGNFDIILDDGGHTMKQQQVSFATLFPFLKSGGIYIIEDLHTSYWDLPRSDRAFTYPYKHKRSTVDFLKSLVDDVNFVGAKTARADHDRDLSFLGGELTIYKKDILSITFYDSLCIITKR